MSIRAYSSNLALESIFPVARAFNVRESELFRGRDSHQPSLITMILFNDPWSQPAAH